MIGCAIRGAEVAFEGSGVRHDRQRLVASGFISPHRGHVIARIGPALSRNDMFADTLVLIATHSRGTGHLAASA